MTPGWLLAYSPRLITVAAVSAARLVAARPAGRPHRIWPTSTSRTC